MSSAVGYQQVQITITRRHCQGGVYIRFPLQAAAARSGLVPLASAAAAARSGLVLVPGLRCGGSSPRRSPALSFWSGGGGGSAPALLRATLSTPLRRGRLLARRASAPQGVRCLSGACAAFWLRLGSAGLFLCFARQGRAGGACGPAGLGFRFLVRLRGVPSGGLLGKKPNRPPGGGPPCRQPL